MQKPLDSSESDEYASPVAPPGGGLLSAAIGVTRAVTQFLGAALQVCCYEHFIVTELCENSKNYYRVLDDRYNRHGLVNLHLVRRHQTTITLD